MSTKAVSRKINDLIEKYRITPSSTIPSKRQHSRLSPENVVVLLTGTTGSLGSYILSYLLESPDVSTIYALNRKAASELKTRQAQSFVDKGLSPRLLDDRRLSLLVGDLELEHFGLDSELYDEISEVVTLIIHIAWPVNFTQPLRSFETNINGSCQLIKFALSSPNASFIRFLFASSISTSFKWKQSRPVPEEVLQDVSCTVGFGYAEAKYVVDRILDETPLNSASLRIGQLCGSKNNGAWPIEEWVPLLVKTSLALGSLPSHPGNVSWLSVDMTGRYIVDIALSPNQEHYPAMFNLMSPAPVSFDRAMQLIDGALIEEGIMSAPLGKHSTWLKWIEDLEQHAEALGPLAATVTPSIKLVKSMRLVVLASHHSMTFTHSEVYSKREFGLVGPFETSNTSKWSTSFRKIKVLDERDAQRWVRYWKQRRFMIRSPAVNPVARL